MLMTAFGMDWHTLLLTVSTMECLLTIQHNAWQNEYEREYTEMSKTMM